MADRIYAGTSIFFANRTVPNDNHNWLVNNARPMMTETVTHEDGSKTYTDLFLNNQAVTVKETAKNISITFPKDIRQPVFRYLEKA